MKKARWHICVCEAFSIYFDKKGWLCDPKNLLLRHCTHSRNPLHLQMEAPRDEDEMFTPKHTACFTACAVCTLSEWDIKWACSSEAVAPAEVRGHMLRSAGRKQLLQPPLLYHQGLVSGIHRVFEWERVKRVIPPTARRQAEKEESVVNRWMSKWFTSGNTSVLWHLTRTAYC